MTLLQAVNKVLEKLREDPVTGLTADYPRLIAGFVNEAKEDIENMGPWYALRTTVNTTLTAGQASQTLVSVTNDRSYLLYSKNQPQAFMVTDNLERRFQVVEQSEVTALNALNPDQGDDVPYAVAIRRNNDGLVAQFWPAPDAAYDVRFVFVIPQDDLDDATDEISIPGGPVWRLALFYALEERGEDFAGPAARAEQRAKQAIADAMMADFLQDELTVEAQ